MLISVGGCVPTCNLRSRIGCHSCRLFRLSWKDRQGPSLDREQRGALSRPRPVTDIFFRRVASGCISLGKAIFVSFEPGPLYSALIMDKVDPHLHVI
jgi:hypothetical protein